MGIGSGMDMRPNQITATPYWEDVRNYHSGFISMDKDWKLLDTVTWNLRMKPTLTIGS